LLERNCRPETTRSIPVVGVRATRSGTLARFSTKPLPPPNPAVVASTSKDADISPADPASEHRSAESRESLPIRDDSQSTGGHPGDASVFSGARARFSSTASISNGPVRAIDPPSALLILFIRHFAKHNHPVLKSLYWVMQQLLVFYRRRAFEKDGRVGAMLWRAFDRTVWKVAAGDCGGSG
jgi:hypothetical protein